MLTITNLSKRFGQTQALNGVSLTVQPGTVTALIGPNGSGKSTAVKIVSGLLRPDSGTVEVCGHDVVCDPISAKRALGYVPDDPYIWSGMTGEEFIHFTGALFGMSGHQRTKAMTPLLEEFGIGGISTGLFEEYSRGNKQKFSLVAALMHKPQVLLVDEPIVGLDPTSAATAERLFKEYAAQGGALLLVTHTLPVAERLADRIDLLLYSTLRASGTVQQLQAEAKLGAKSSLGDIYAALTAK